MSKVIRILHGWIYWRLLCIFNRITYNSVVLVLVNENELVDENAVKYLDLYMNRKNANNAVIIWDKEDTKRILKDMKLPKSCKCMRLPTKRIDLIYDYYCFDIFFENIVFTYISKPQDNILDRVLEETEVDEKDVVCLALYHLRYIPELR